MTAGTTLKATSRPIRGLALAAALLLPISLGGPALAEDGGAATMAEAFAHIALPQPQAEVAPGAVDVTKLAPQPEAARTPIGSGVASYYGSQFHGRRTASGARFDMHAMTAAHRTLPFGSKVRVTNAATGASVVVTINDRGPFTHGRLIDVSQAAASELGLIARGHGTVELELLDS